LIEIDEDIETIKKIAYINESKAFDAIDSQRTALRKGKDLQIEIHNVALQIQKEVVEEAIRGVWSEVHRLSKFSKGVADDAILTALSNARSKDNADGARTGIWFGSLFQIQEDRDDVFGDHEICTRSSNFGINFITDDDLDGSKKRRKKHRDAGKVGYEDYKIPSVTDTTTTIASIGDIDKIPADDKYRAKPDSLAKLAKLETKFWEKATLRRVLIDLPKNQGGVSQVELGIYKNGGMSRVMIAAGTTKGGLMIYSYDTKNTNDSKPQLIRFLDATLFPKTERSPINFLQWSIDGSSQLISLAANKVVRVWSLEAESSAEKTLEHTKDAFGEDPAKYTPAIPAMALTLTAENFHRPAFVDNEIKATVDKELAEKGGGGWLGGGAYVPKLEELKKLQSRYSWRPSDENLRPSTAKFHPSLTMLAMQPSLVVGLENGMLVKWNSVKSIADEVTISGKNVIYGRSIARMEPADPKGKGAEKLIFTVDREKGECAQREFFEFHKAAIMCVHFVNNLQLDMVSVDETGWVALWKYEEELFSQHNWFTPNKKVKLDFGGDAHGHHVKILDIKPSVNGRELIFLIGVGDEYLKIFVFELTTLQFLPENIVHRLHRKYVVAPTLSVSPMVASSGTDYVYLTVSGEVFLYSIASGEEVKVGGKKFKPDEIVGDILGVSVGVSGDVLVYETPETNKHLIVDVIDFGACWGDGPAEAMRKEMGDLRPPRWLGGERSMMIIPEKSLWEEDLGAEDVIEVLKEIIIDCAEQAIVVSEEREKALLEEKLAEEARKKAEEEVKDDIFETFLGSESLGSVEPVSLKDMKAVLKKGSEGEKEKPVS
jgi:hypothetical protein